MLTLESTFPLSGETVVVPFSVIVTLFVCSSFLPLTAVFVALGLVRYIRLVYSKADVGRPEKILLSDWPMWIILAGYGVSALVAVLLRHVVTVSGV